MSSTSEGDDAVVVLQVQGLLTRTGSASRNTGSAPDVEALVRRKLGLSYGGGAAAWRLIELAVAHTEPPQPHAERPLEAARLLLALGELPKGTNAAVFVSFPERYQRGTPNKQPVPVNDHRARLGDLFRYAGLSPGARVDLEHRVSQRRVLAGTTSANSSRGSWQPDKDQAERAAQALLARMLELLADRDVMAELRELEEAADGSTAATVGEESVSDVLGVSALAGEQAVGQPPDAIESAALSSNTKGVLNEPETVDAEPTAATQITRPKRPVIFVSGLVVLLVVVLAVVIGNYWPAKSPTTENPAGARPAPGANDNWQADWGPDRSVFSVHHPPSYTVLNSFTDNPEVGDERNFVRIKPVGSTNAAYTDVVRGDVGDEFIVYAYIQNDAGDALGEGASVNGLAAELYLPRPGDDLSVGVTYSGYNAAAVWDGASVVTPSEAQLAYVPASAVFHSASAPGGTYRPSDEDFSLGKKMTLGSEGPDGVLPVGVTPAGDLIGTGYLTFRVKVTPLDDPGQTSTSSPSATEPSSATTSSSEPSPSLTDDYYEAGWGPRRQMYSLNEGGSPYPAFNGIYDNPNFGDERNFVGLRDATLTDGYWSDDVWAEPGDTFYMRTFVDNSGSDLAEVMPAGRIQDARLQIGISHGVREYSVFSLLKAVNADSVWDGSRLHVDDGVEVAFVPGSAHLESNAFPDGGRSLSDHVFDDGVKLGYRHLNGVIRPGYKYSLYITVQISVTSVGAEGD